MVAMGGGQCRIIMRDGVLLPGMTMPALGPPPPDPHPNAAVQRLRDAWDMRIIAWYDGPRYTVRREVVAHWATRRAVRQPDSLFDQDPEDPE